MDKIPKNENIILAGDFNGRIGKVKLKVKQSRYRPEGPRWFQEVKVTRFRDNGTGWC